MIDKKINAEKKIYLVHGWDGRISKYWYPSTIKMLKTNGFHVLGLNMPNTSQPNIEEWLNFMKKKISVDQNTYFIGHSIGCQAILRFLASQKRHAGGCVFVAGWFKLKEYTYTENPEIESAVRMIASSWINTPLDFAAAKKYSGAITAIFSDNDYYVDIANVSIFQKKLGANVIIQHNKGHFGAKENLKSLPIVVKEMMKISLAKKPKYQI